MTTEAPKELQDGVWYRVSLVDIDLDEVEFKGQKSIKAHYVLGTVAKFEDGKRRFIKFCRGSNMVPVAGKESKMFKDSVNDKVWTSFGVKDLMQKNFGGYVIATEQDREDIKGFFLSKTALCQVKVVEKNGKIYGNYQDIKALPEGTAPVETAASFSKPRIRPQAKAPY